MKEKSIAAEITKDGKIVDKNTGKVINPSDVIKTADIYITDVAENTIISTTNSDGELAKGIAIPTYRKKSWDYLSDVKDFDEVEGSDIYKQMEVCDKLYRFEPVIGTAIDIFINFAITKFNIITDSDELKKIFTYEVDNFNKFDYGQDYLFAYPMGLEAFAREISSEWFITGNVFPHIFWTREKIDGKVYKIPFRGINLNPNSIKIERNTRPVGTVKITYYPNGVKGNAKNTDGTTININGGSNIGSLISPKIEKINHRNLYHIKRGASGYRLWGKPFLARTFTAVKAKRKLRYLDDATIDGLVNYIIIFKIGSPDVDSKFHMPSQERINAFKSLIENPQASNMVVWPHDIDVITVGPDNKVLEFEKRYEVVDRDIIRSLGVPTVLLDGAGGNVQVTWTSIMALVERLEELRESISNYLIWLFHRIAEENNIEYNTLKFMWRPANLRDEKTIKNLLLAFYDRGLLPIESTLFYANYDPQEIITIKKKEESEGLQELFQRRDIPYSPTPENKIKKNPTEGRPTDNTSVANVSLSYLKDTVYSQIDNLYEDIKDFKNVNYKVENKILAHFTKLNQIVSVISDAEIEDRFDSETIDKKLFAEFSKWRENSVNEIMTSFSDSLKDSLAYIRKKEVSNYIIKGAIAELKDTFSSFGNNLFIVIDNILPSKKKKITISSDKTDGNSKSVDIKKIFDYISFNGNFVIK